MVSWLLCDELAEVGLSVSSNYSAHSKNNQRRLLEVLELEF